MKVAILAGGLGTRLSEETTIKPKPMVDVGGKPGEIITHDNDGKYRIIHLWIRLQKRKPEGASNAKRI